MSDCLFWNRTMQEVLVHNHSLSVPLPLTWESEAGGSWIEDSKSIFVWLLFVYIYESLYVYSMYIYVHNIPPLILFNIILLWYNYIILIIQYQNIHISVEYISAVNSDFELILTWKYYFDLLMQHLSHVTFDSVTYINEHILVKSPVTGASFFDLSWISMFLICI